MPSAVDEHGAGSETFDLHTAPDLDTVIGVHRRDGGAHLGTEAAHQRRGATFEHDDLVAELAGGGGHLEPDEAGADDHDAPIAAGQALAEIERVVEGPENDGVRVRLLTRQPACRRSRRRDQSVERHLRTIGQPDDSTIEVE